MRKAIFFDRDGTLNEFKLGDYITQVEELVLLNGAARAVKKANAAGYLCIIVTNQGGVIHNRGLAYSDVERINERLVQLLNEEGGKLMEFMFVRIILALSLVHAVNPKLA